MSIEVTNKVVRLGLQYNIWWRQSERGLQMASTAPLSYLVWSCTGESTTTETQTQHRGYRKLCIPITGVTGVFQVCPHNSLIRVNSWLESICIYNLVSFVNLMSIMFFFMRNILFVSPVWLWVLSHLHHFPLWLGSLDRCETNICTLTRNKVTDPISPRRGGLGSILESGAFFCGENTTNPATRANRLEMCCLATGTKRPLVNMVIRSPTLMYCCLIYVLRLIHSLAIF